MSIYDRSVETESRPAGMGSHGLPDDPNLEMEMAAAFPDGEPTEAEIEAEHQWFQGQRPADWYDVPCQRCGTAIHVMPGEPMLCPACQRDPQPPAGGAPPVTFDRFETYQDSDLIAAIGMADDERDPLQLGKGRDAYLNAASAELVRRLDARQPSWISQVA